MNKENKTHYLKVQDHSVSKEYFDLYHDNVLDMLITNPQPNHDNIGKYYDSPNYLSHTDANKSLFEKLYQVVKNIALKNKLNLINNLSSSKGKILDIGAGTGDFLSYIKQNGWQTIGVEPNQKARKIAEDKGVYFVDDANSLEDHTFDVITMWHVLEHVPDLDKQISELKRLLKPEGTLIVAVPNFKSFDANHYKEYWAAFDVPIHFWHFSKKAVKLLFQKYDMILENIYPMKFDAFYVALLSEKYKTGKMNYIKAISIGLQSNFKAIKTSEYSSHIYILKNNNKLS